MRRQGSPPRSPLPSLPPLGLLGACSLPHCSGGHGDTTMPLHRDRQTHRKHRILPKLPEVRRSEAMSPLSVLPSTTRPQRKYFIKRQLHQKG